MKTRHWLQGLGAALVGGGCLWMSLRGVDIGLVLAELEKVSWLWVGAALVGVVTVSVGKALRWLWLYPQSASTVRWTSHFSILLIAQMLNIIIPVRVGEIARLGLMHQEQRPVGMTLGTIAVEKSLDLVAAGLLLMLAVPIVILPEWLRPAAGYGVLAVGGGLLLLTGISWRLLLGWLASLPRPRREPWARWVRRLIGLLETTLQGIGGLGSSGRLLPAVGITALTWMLSVGVVQAMLLAFGVEGGGTVSLALMLALTFSNLAPTPPALVGLVGAVTEGVLVPFGVPRPQALALGTILNIVLVGPLVVMGGWAAMARLLRGFAAPDRKGLRHALGLARHVPRR